MPSTSVVVSAITGSLFVTAAVIVLMNDNSSFTRAASGVDSTELMAATTQLGAFKCIDRWGRCTDQWCKVNCNHNPAYCPRSYCRAANVAPPVPPPSPPPPAPANNDPKCISGLIGVHYSSATSRGDSASVEGASICCPRSCGSCGGSKCGDRPGGKEACCSDKVFAAGKKCTDNKPPCVGVDTSETTQLDADAALQTETELDVLTQDRETELAAGQFKCIDRWRRCTDQWCNVNCNHNPAYCPRSYCRAANVAPPVPPKPPPPPPAHNDPKCIEGLTGVYYSSATARGDAESVKGNAVCCPASCGQCGGDKCAERPGGAACCADKVFAMGKQCADNKAPCVGVDVTELDAVDSNLHTETELDILRTVTPTQLAGAKFKCIDRWRRCNDQWCNVNCNHRPSYCPPGFCRGVAVAPPVPPPPPPVPPPVNKDPQCLSGLMGVYYSSSTQRGDGESVKGNAVCCPASCGQCGGDKCAERPGGAACCSDKVFATGKQCADNMPPCVGVAL